MDLGCGSGVNSIYLYNKDTANLYGNIYDILDKSGYFVFRVNSMNEYEYSDKDDAAEIIEENYYRLKDGSRKRYFDTHSLIALLILKGFKVIDINESSFDYRGRRKFFIDGIAQKMWY